LIPALPSPGEIIADKAGIISRPWFAFFRSFLETFLSKDWTPAITGLVVTGTVTVTARYTLSGGILYFDIEIAPSGGGTSQSTAGVTIITNSPMEAVRNGVVPVASSAPVSSLGVAIARKGTRNIALPTWGPTSETVLISGSVQIGV
jgi:hypothetical protein